MLTFIGCGISERGQAIYGEYNANGNEGEAQRRSANKLYDPLTPSEKCLYFPYELLWRDF